MGAIAVIGAGPTGTCLVERILANAPEFLGHTVLDLHVVDPHPHGPCAVRQAERLDLLWAESAAADITLYTDGSVRCEGPIRSGPSLAEWLGCDPGHFAPRPALSRYLSDVFERAVRAAPGNVRVHVHREEATGLAELPGRQRVELAGGRWLEADAVILVQGRQGVLPTPEEDAQLAFAARHNLLYLPTGHPADLSLDELPAGRPVLVRGAGLAFFDLMVLLTTGRGGRFTRSQDGEPVYRPSGAEPLLHVGSRRGVPFHARTGYRLAGPTPGPPRFLTPGALPAETAELRELIAKELAYAYYRELFTAHPSRTRLEPAAFLDAFAAAAWDGRQMRALVTKAVPRFADRLHLDRLERPLRGMRFGDSAGLQRWMHGYLAADLERRADAAYSADLAMIHGLFAVHDALPEAARDPWFQRLSGFLAGGPPGPRLAELRALARAGVVTFLGADLRIEQEERAGAWRATSPTVPGSVEARALVEARLPAPSVDRSTDPLIAGLYARGEIRDASGLPDVWPADGRLLGQDGVPHPRRFAMGRWAVSGFARPHADAPLLRHADMLARTVLAQTAAAGRRAAA
ncbi:FAD/NAD(P)-binding protein [Nonomuraea mangrovi]|uniref:FAD/NAD(P)-binding protein n=1 Tax=Nonomuraea mangrovi TaxID=2316207 RepID=A0ABW4SPY4_9ACTN